MLKIAELKLLAEAAEAEPFTDATEKAVFAASDAAWVAYWKEGDEALALKARYEAMGDEDGEGEVNAGDTFGPEHGDIRFKSTEFWNCAIGTVEMGLTRTPVKQARTQGSESACEP